MDKLCELRKSIGAMYLQGLQWSDNAHYTSECFKQELVEALAETVTKPIQESLCKPELFLHSSYVTHANANIPLKFSGEKTVLSCQSVHA